MARGRLSLLQALNPHRRDPEGPAPHAGCVPREIEHTQRRRHPRGTIPEPLRRRHRSARALSQPRDQRRRRAPSRSHPNRVHQPPAKRKIASAALEGNTLLVSASRPADEELDLLQDCPRSIAPCVRSNRVHLRGRLC